jgi:hypothetical protein
VGVGGWVGRGVERGAIESRRLGGGCCSYCASCSALLHFLGSRLRLRFRRCRGLAGCSSCRFRPVRRRRERSQSRLVRCCRGFSLAKAPMHSTMPRSEYPTPPIRGVWIWVPCGVAIGGGGGFAFAAVGCASPPGGEGGQGRGGIISYQVNALRLLRQSR